MQSVIEAEPLITFLKRVPGVRASIGTGVLDGGGWWVKFGIDITHALAWRAVQELGYVLNYLSIDERLPTVFMPVSPPPYMNGGPAGFLSWVIECRDLKFSPSMAAAWLESRLPNPVEDETGWVIDEV
jgi:hypothetical protein